MWGNNNTVIFGANTKRFTGTIHIGTKDCPVDNCPLQIGDNSSANKINIFLLEDNSNVIIGKDCMFSSGISIFCSDTHSIIQNNKLINEGKSINIGDHVWVGMDVKISKNTQILSNSVVGWGSIVTKKFNKENIIIAGNPAQIVKENISWSRLRPKHFLQNDLVNK